MKYGAIWVWTPKTKNKNPALHICRACRCCEYLQLLGFFIFGPLVFGRFLSAVCIYLIYSDTDLLILPSLSGDVWEIAKGL
uniref:Uncharacterized protein n=1 Tax=Manihot esculenta TaxID=3983 RepID=A0A251LQY9_MANES